MGARSERERGRATKTLFKTTTKATHGQAFALQSMEVGKRIQFLWSLYKGRIRAKKGTIKYIYATSVTDEKAGFPGQFRRWGKIGRGAAAHKGYPIKRPAAMSAIPGCCCPYKWSPISLSCASIPALWGSRMPTRISLLKNLGDRTT